MNYSFLNNCTGTFLQHRATVFRDAHCILSWTRDRSIELAQKVSVMRFAPSKSQTQNSLFMLGLLLLLLASGSEVEAKHAINYNDDRLRAATNALLLYLEGSFGALVMVSSGIGAILSAAFGQYRAALGLMVVAIGSFILRSLLGTFFNDEGIAQ